MDTKNPNDFHIIFIILSFRLSTFTTIYFFYLIIVTVYYYETLIFKRFQQLFYVIRPSCLEKGIEKSWIIERNSSLFFFLGFEWYGWNRKRNTYMNWKHRLQRQETQELGGVDKEIEDFFFVRSVDCRMLPLLFKRYKP